MYNYIIKNKILFAADVFLIYLPKCSEYYDYIISIVLLKNSSKRRWIAISLFMRPLEMKSEDHLLLDE